MRRSLGSPRGTRASAGRPTAGPSLSASGGTADAASHVRRLTQLRSPSAAGTSRSAMSPVGNCHRASRGNLCRRPGVVPRLPQQRRRERRPFGDGRFHTR
jgi:hypothetical protein